jgi:hypothetical protein
MSPKSSLYAPQDKQEEHYVIAYGTMNLCEDREYLNHKDIEEKMFTRV